MLGGILTTYDTDPHNKIRRPPSQPPAKRDWRKRTREMDAKKTAKPAAGPPKKFADKRKKG